MLTLRFDEATNYYKHDIKFPVKESHNQINLISEEYVFNLKKNIDKLLRINKIKYCQFYITIPTNVPILPPNQ